MSTFVVRASVAAAVLAGALAASLLLGARLVTPAAAAPAPRESWRETAEDEAADTPPTHETSAREILARNPFDSQTGPLTLPICLGATLERVVLSSEPAWSLAELSVGARRDALHVVRVGARVGALDVEAIGRDGVRLRGPGGACLAAPWDATATLSERCAKAGYPYAPPCLVRRGPTTLDVAASLVDHALEQQAELMTCARIVPEQDRDGRVVGVRLFAARAGSALAALGFENGDVLRTINGFDMTSPDRALEAYAKLRNASELRVGLVRRGEPLVLVFRIR